MPRKKKQQEPEDVKPNAPGLYVTPICDAAGIDEDRFGADLAKVRKQVNAAGFEKRAVEMARAHLGPHQITALAKAIAAEGISRMPPEE